MQGISVIDLAQDKRIHPNWLLSECGVTDIRSKGRPVVRIPYPNADGTEFSRYRIRTDLVAKDNSYWSEGDEQLIPYGLDRLADARQLGYLIVNEGGVN